MRLLPQGHKRITSVTLSPGGPYCPSAAVSVTFTISTSTGSFKGGNTFSAQLSDANGVFAATPVVIGTLKSTAAGTINAILPAAPVQGSGYLIRVTASNPATIGPNSSAFTINSSCGGGGGGSVALALDSLTDVVISSPVSNQMLKYNGTSWVNNVAAISDITGLQTALDAKLAKNSAITGATNTKITFDANGLVTAGANAVVADISGLQDSLNVKLAKNAGITGATKTKITYDANGLVTAGDSASLTDLRGVSINSPTSNQVLTYNGSKWVNANPSGGGGGGPVALDSLTDVVISSPASKQVLKYNGTNWVNAPLALDSLTNINITSPSDGQALTYNAGSGKWVNSTVSGGGGGGGWSLTGNSGLSSTTNFIGTTDDVDVNFKRNSINSGKIGTKNASFGLYSLNLNTTGTENVAIGTWALSSNRTGRWNTSIGDHAMVSNNDGRANTAVGADALSDNASGENNVAVGYASLQYNTVNYNTAIGAAALQVNESGYNNTAVGCSSLRLTLGESNTALGYHAGYLNRNGSYNVFIGEGADVPNANGFYGKDFSNSIAIGYSAIVDTSNKVRIGNSSIAWIEGQVPFTNPSDGRYKKNVKEDAPGLNLIMRLRPVTYNFEYTKFSEHLKEKNTDKTHLRQRESQKEMGFVAQEVEKALKDAGTDVSNLVNVPQNTDGYYTLAYSELVVPLVKAVQEQQKIIEDLKKAVEVLQKQSPTATIGGTAAQTATVLEMPAATTLLGQNIPNPFDTKTIIPFRLPANCNSAAIVITNVTTGQIIRAIPVSSKETQLSLDASKLPSGSYAYSLYVNGKSVDTKKMTMAR